MTGNQDVEIALLSQQLSSMQSLFDTRLGGLESKIDAFAADHEERLRRVERWMYAIPASLVTAVISITVTILETLRH